MANEIYKKWLPIEGIPKKLYCEGIHDDYEGFRVLLKEEDSQSLVVRLTFETVLAYRNIDESYLLRTVDNINSPGESTLYIVENSLWVKWLHEESYGTLEGKNITHYAIYTPNDCLDILAEHEPKIEWL